MTEIVQFDYGDEALAEFCDGAAWRIRALMRHTVENMVEIGRLLGAVKARLPHGAYQPWLEANFPGSLSSARRCRRLARHVERWPVLMEIESVEVALEMPRLDPDLRDRVIEKRAFTWSAFEKLLKDHMCAEFRRGIDECLADEGRPWRERLGDVMAWAEEGLKDEALEPVAREVWERHREAVARLSDRSPSEVDAEVGYRQPRDSAGQWGSLYDAEDLWLCRKRADGSFEPVVRIRQQVTLWPDPRIALALVDDGPATAAWQGAAVEAIRERLSLRTHEDLAAVTL